MPTPLSRFRLQTDARLEARTAPSPERAWTETQAWVHEGVVDFNQRLDELQSPPPKSSRFPRLAELRQSVFNPYRADPITGEPPPTPRPAMAELLHQAVDLRPWSRDEHGKLKPAFPMGLRLVAFGGAGYYAGMHGYDLAHLPALITNDIPNVLDAHWHVSLEKRGAAGAVLGDATGELPTTLGTAMVHNWLWRRGRRLAQRQGSAAPPSPPESVATVKVTDNVSKPKPKSRR